MKLDFLKMDAIWMTMNEIVKSLDDIPHRWPQGLAKDCFNSSETIRRYFYDVLLQQPVPTTCAHGSNEPTLCKECNK